MALLAPAAGGVIFGDLPPYEAFPIGGTNSVRGYSEGGVGSGRSYVAGTAELHAPIYGPVEVGLSALRTRDHVRAWGTHMSVFTAALHLACAGLDLSAFLDGGELWECLEQLRRV